MTEVTTKSREIVATQDGLLTPDKEKRLVDDLKGLGPISMVSPQLAAAQIGMKLLAGPTSFIIRIMTNIFLFIAFLLVLVGLILFGVPKLTGAFIKSFNPTTQQRLAKMNYAMVNDAFSTVDGVDVDTVPLNKIEALFGLTGKSQSMVYINVPKFKIDNPIFNDQLPEAKEAIKNALTKSIDVQAIEGTTKNWQLKYDGAVIAPAGQVEKSDPDKKALSKALIDALSKKGYVGISWVVLPSK
ncbi:MAG: hypothetical protein LBS41_03960 [Streptococcaceae bacterium]|jgi:hypothetical protein|nr:hypothetical protein [Streptococcaceae bacterium]